MDTDTIMAQHVPTHPGLGNQGRNSWHKLGKGKGPHYCSSTSGKKSLASASPIPLALPETQPFGHLLALRFSM